MSKEKEWLIQQKKSAEWYKEDKATRVIEALSKNGFESFYIPTKEKALEKLLELIPKGSKVGIAGSMTIRQIKLDEELRKRGDHVLDIWAQKYAPQEHMAIRKQHFDTDIFLTSSNAVTEDGKLINIDGLGNRVAAMIFGPKKVIVVAGINKIVKNVDEGIQRIRNVAAPMNVKRFGGKTPCTQKGYCKLDECEPPERHCHVISIIEKKPMKTDAIVMIIGESLGF